MLASRPVNKVSKQSGLAKPIPNSSTNDRALYQDHINNNNSELLRKRQPGAASLLPPCE